MTAIAYTKRTDRLSRLETLIRARLHTTQNARLAVAGLFFLSLILSASRVLPGIELPAVLIFSVVFSVLVWRSRQLQTFALRLKSLREFYQRQHNRSRGIAVERAWEQALEALPAEADRANVSDLNLIGPHSLYSLLDETVSDGGRKELVRWMTEAPQSAATISERQKLVRGLIPHRWLFIRLILSAKETELELSTHQAVQFLKSPFLNPKASYWVLAVSLLWVACLGGLIWSVTTEQPYATLFFMAYIGGAFLAFNQIGPVFMRGVGLANHLAGLMGLFERLEKANHSNELKSLIPKTLESRPSKQLRRFNFVLAFLSAEAHPLVYLLLNALFPWAPVFSWFLEQERKKIDQSFPACLDEFHRLEVLSSLSFLSIYQTRTTPELSEETRLEGTQLFHPIIPRESVVANDFSFSNGKLLGLLTGSNMSGKSTFLRTIGVNQTLANMGANVFANRFATSPFQLGTCIQISDSLRDGFSYFYSEVLRLSKLINQIRSGTRTLFLVDEIFRGTNNRERQIGSRAVIRSLVHPKSVGFVSTHDLELTSLSETVPQVENLHFREDIDASGKMVFSYRLQKGPCPTTNALKIMELSGIDLSFELGPSSGSSSAPKA